MASQDLKRADLIVSKFHQSISLIRLAPFDTDTPEGRSRERLRRAALTALASAFAQGINLLTMLVSIPLTLNYLGTERYGLWVTMSSLMTLLAFADLGMGNGLLNSIAEANGRNDRGAAKSYVSSAFYMLCSVAVLSGMVWIALYEQISWHWLFNVVTPQAIAETGPALSVFICCMLINLPMSLVQKVHEGYQEGYVNGLWRAGGSLLGLISVLLAIYLQAGLPYLVLAMAGSPLLILVLNAFFLFYYRRPWLRPRWSLVRWDAFTRILKNGILFFILQLAVAIGFQSDTVVIAHYLGADQVPQYAVPMKLFMLIPTLLGFVVTPLWPAYGEAIARRDLTWVRTTFKRSLLLSFGVSVLPSLLLIFFGGRIVEVWVGPEIQPTLILLVGLGLWTILSSVGVPISILLNGVNVIRFQIICASLMAAGNLLLSIVFVQRVGVPGPVYGSILAWTLFSLLPSVFYLPYLFASWKGMEPSSKSIHSDAQELHLDRELTRKLD